MRVLLDENMPRKLTALFDGPHEVKTIAQCGWKGTKNGALLRLAEAEFDVLVTVDQGIPHQHDLSKYDLGFILIKTFSNRLEDLTSLMPRVNEALKNVDSGKFIRVIA